MRDRPPHHLRHAQRGAAGQRYRERMWTAIATCGKQGRSFFHFLHESIEAKINDQAAPSLGVDAEEITYRSQLVKDLDMS